MSVTREKTNWIDEPVVGRTVRYTYALTHDDGEHVEGSGSGTYIGVALDEEEGNPMHYFVGGEINGTSQRCHGFPAKPGTPTTTNLTPTQLIGTWLAPRGEIA